jgi:hypothetical protein
MGGIRKLRRLAVFVPAMGLALALIIIAQARATEPAADQPPAEAEVAPPPPPPPPPGERPEKVYVGIYLKEVPTIDLKANTYLADFYLWFRWKGDIDPTASFEFTNAVQAWDMMKTAVYDQPDSLPDGSLYQVFHVQGTFAHAFPLHAYPFDQQDLVIDLEDNEYQTGDVVYVDDAGNTGYHADLELPGWQIDRFSASVTEARYRTNFGDPRVQAGGDTYSHYRFTLHVRRPALGYLVKTVLPIAIVILITFVVFFINSKYFEGRLGLAITSLISAVALQLTSSSDLPSVGYMVLLDRIYNVSYAVIFLTLLESVIAVRLTDAGQEEKARRLDRIAVISLATLFFGSTVLIILLR